MNIDSHNASPAGIQVNTIVLTFTLVAGMIVFLRLFTRLVLSRMAGFEDICIVGSMTLSLVLTVKTSEQVMHGLGRHTKELTNNERLTFLKAFWVNLSVYSLALTMIKVSILIQYLRIFPVRCFQKGCFLLLGVIVAYGAWTVFGNIFLCSPIAFFWDKSVDDGHCLDRVVLWFANAGVNIAQDIIILLLPMPLIQTLQISKNQKRGLVMMFALGASVSLVSIIRLYSLGNIARSNDLPFDNPAHAILSAVEVNVGIICACLPAMRPLLALMMPKYFSAAAQYTNVPVMLDLEQRPTHKHARTPSDTTRSRTTRTHTGRNTPRTATPQAPRPTLSRTPSGRFSVQNSRPSTPIAIPKSQFSHSRTGSNISIDIAAAEARSNSARFQGRLNPLRMSPISPPNISRFSFQPFGSESYLRKPSDASGIIAPSSSHPQTATSKKPLPITPFPVAGG
ncbi:hypothetical protein EK21DRAFT_52355 [Setomelanomma holmii]|uniref:Rhodopsin domain-containing protein n=1 Tax=Setomelanomma holmii TaxID=210430 RepID=A0A9P4LTX9_9PLEO|nr:hypothetical protein EK21DRAFT_52355 [Setomelanomma holmii]